MAEARTSGRARRRALALLLGLLLAPVGVEIALRLAGLGMERSRAPEPAPSAAGEAVGEPRSLVLCLGDSNTFGLYLQPEDSYPGQLQALLDRQTPGALEAERVVVNRGVPGKSTWVVLDELADDLMSFMPRAAVVMAGVNDRNATRPGSGTWEWLADLRLVRLLRLVRAAEEEQEVRVRERQEGLPLASRDERPWVLNEQVAWTSDGTRTIRFRDRAGVEAPFELLAGEPGESRVRGWIAEDLEQVAQALRARGVVPILMNYPVRGFPFDSINSGIERAAERAGCRRIDPREAFDQAIERAGKPNMLFADGHPTRAGYSVLARLVRNALIEEGLVAGEVCDPLEEIEGATAGVLEVAVRSEGGKAVGVDALFAPGFDAVLLVSHAVGETKLSIEEGALVLAVEGQPSWSVGLADGFLLRHSLRWQYYAPARLNGDGRVALALPQAPKGGWPETALASVLVLGPGPRVFAASEPVELRP